MSDESIGGQLGGRLAGRRIIVTGAASGIGRATAELFHREGARLALFDKNVAGLNAVSASLGALALPFDLRDFTAITPAVDRSARELGGLDGVVNCAGVAVVRSIGGMDGSLLSELLAVNLTAPYVVCRDALPHLAKAPHAAIVNIASATGILPNAPNMTAYAATKGGLVAFTKALAAEAAPRVRANAVCPGITNTTMSAPAFAGYPNHSDAPILQQYALKRAAEPIEIARAALYLVSDESSFVTGIALVVDGGRCFH
jgi:NAD(P)-dependent dehydrogenase (short-subunit alcohol dehydrogenase family)